MQNSIVLLVDVEAALADSDLADNVYLVDNTRALGSRDEGRATMVSCVAGVHNPDGSPAAEAVLNWIAYGISALPPTLPRSFNLRSHHVAHDHALLEKLAATTHPRDVAALLAAHHEEHGAFGAQRSAMPYLPVDPRSATGEFVSPDAVDYAAHLNPEIVAIRGEAVEKGVIFPALYGSPDFYTEGWYWSASVDTNKVGLHDYILDLRLLRPTRSGGAVTWAPEIHPFKVQIEVSASTMVNGFTGGPLPGVLPLAPPPFPAAEGAL
ncbi:hypothetical protein [Cereibacter changlensis]|uniref:hypothetical protein n=1 Tax=Cereibacter changlensis TaxID=402884 RepID=UPI004033E635